MNKELEERVKNISLLLSYVISKNSLLISTLSFLRLYFISTFLIKYWMKKIKKRYLIAIEINKKLDERINEIKKK